MSDMSNICPARKRLQVTSNLPAGRHGERQEIYILLFEFIENYSKLLDGLEEYRNTKLIINQEWWG